MKKPKPNMECQECGTPVYRSPRDHGKLVRCSACHFNRGKDTKRCVGCALQKPIKEFPSKGRRCRACKRLRLAAWRKDNPRLWENQRGWYFRKHYGITVQMYQSMLDAQGGVCCLCGDGPLRGSTRQNLAVDHDHRTGTVRGLLCHGCNVALGFLDNPTLLHKAADYLEAHA